jgi:hypothetical protein
VGTSVVPPGLVPIVELDSSAEALGYFRDTPPGLFLHVSVHEISFSDTG